MELTTTEINTIQHYFKAKPVKKAFLFGSYLRKNATSESDIDILVELDYSKHIGLGFIQMKQDLEKALNKKVDLLSERAISHYIRPFIEKEKQLIYERTSGG